MVRSSRGQPAIFWTPQMESELRRHYPTTMNRELAEMFGVSRPTIIRIARNWGLKKDAVWLRQMRLELHLLGLSAMKKNGIRGGFKKGNVPTHAFKKGHKGFGAKPCIDLETGIIYESRVAAAKAFGVTDCTILHCIRNFGKCKNHRIRNYPNSFEETEIEHLSKTTTNTYRL